MRGRRTIAKLIGISIVLFSLSGRAETTRFSVDFATVYLQNLTAPVEYGRNGLGGAVRFSVWLRDEWALRLGLVYAFHLDSHLRTQFSQISVDVVYRIDIGRWVPYLALGLGWSLVKPAGEALLVDGALVFGFGLDFQINRRWSVGFEAQNYVFFRDIESYPAYLSMEIHTKVVW